MKTGRNYHEDDDSDRLRDCSDWHSDEIDWSMMIGAGAGGDGNAVTMSFTGCTAIGASTGGTGTSVDRGAVPVTCGANGIGDGIGGIDWGAGRIVSTRRGVTSSSAPEAAGADAVGFAGAVILAHRVAAPRCPVAAIGAVTATVTVGGPDRLSGPAA